MPSHNRVRNVVFTINNYDDAAIQQLDSVPCKYLVYGKETGESGTPHLQGYIEFQKQISFKKAKQLIGSNAHIEKRKGNAQQAATYCKKDGDWKERGEMSNPGKRTDLINMMELIRKRKSFCDIADEMPQTLAKHMRFHDRYKFEYRRQNATFEPCKVTCIIGPAGSGKTRKAYELDPNLFRLTDVNWFDGYDGQKTILLDDYYGEISYSKFLQLCDGYKFQIPVKGSFTWKEWDHVIITSNDHPGLWYSQGFTPAIERRLTIEELKGEG